MSSRTSTAVVLEADVQAGGVRYNIQIVVSSNAMKLAAPSCVFLFCGSAAYSQQPAFPPVTDQMLQNPDPGNWLMWRRTLNTLGYSPPNQTTRATPPRL